MTQEAIDHRGMDTILGPVSKFRGLSTIHKAIFSPHITHVKFADGTQEEVKVWAQGQCRAVIHKGIRYIQQNPTKSTAEAARARAGAQIIWIIEEGIYVGKIEAGIVRRR